MLSTTLLSTAARETRDQPQTSPDLTEEMSLAHPDGTHSPDPEEMTMTTDTKH
jgi:hypothetical protein